VVVPYAKTQRVFTKRGGGVRHNWNEDKGNRGEVLQLQSQWL